MKCESCTDKAAKWQCPECGFTVCGICHDLDAGQCSMCSPHYKKISKRKVKKDARERVERENRTK